MKILVTESQYNLICELGRGGYNKSNSENFIKRAEEIHKNPDTGLPKYDYSLVDYIDSNTPVKVICPEHKDEMLEKTGKEFFEVLPNKHLQGSNKCPFESKRKETKHSDTDLLNAAKNVESSIEFKTKFPSEYFATRKRDKTVPNFYEKITKHFIPKTKESYGESEVAKILDNIGITYERYRVFEYCTNLKQGRSCRKLPFDFYIPNMNTLIEYDGEQHFKVSNLYGEKKFESTVKNDLLKDDFCIKNNIKLIRLHYKVKNLEEELKNALNFNKKFIKVGPY